MELSPYEQRLLAVLEHNLEDRITKRVKMYLDARLAELRQQIDAALIEADAELAADEDDEEEEESEDDDDLDDVARGA